uniref:Uncharacterized protein n=1 Tax=Rhizophora mucronata TaxID=61149 RepID=A0A2P2NRC3_RHIMU
MHLLLKYMGFSSFYDWIW